MTSRHGTIEVPERTTARQVTAHTIARAAAAPRAARVARPRGLEVPEPATVRRIVEIGEPPTVIEIEPPTTLWTRLGSPALARTPAAAPAAGLAPAPAPGPASRTEPPTTGLAAGPALALAQGSAPASPAISLFRPEALAARRGAAATPGRLVTTARTWMRWAYPTLIGLLAAVLVAAAILQVPTYSTGVAIITAPGEPITSPMAGTVAEVLVAPGARVAAGDPVLRLRALEEDAELAATETDYRNALATFLTTPGADGARTALAAVATRRQRARAMVDARTLRAPSAGVVGDVRVRPGQLVTPGAPIMKISRRADPSVVALLPGFDRPRLAVGMTLQIELPGYHKPREQAVIDAIGSQVIGPEEARRSLGDPIGDALPITGPVVIVRAHLAARTFEAGGRAYAFHDGMLGKAEVRVDHESLLRALWPGKGA